MSEQIKTTKCIGNCYLGCAYCCYRNRIGMEMPIHFRNGQVRRTSFVKDDRFPGGKRPSDSYFLYCPKNPVTGFDTMEEIDDEFNLIKGLFHVNYVMHTNAQYCSCYETKYSKNPFTREQDRVDEYSRMSFRNGIRFIGFI